MLVNETISTPQAAAIEWGKRLKEQLLSGGRVEAEPRTAFTWLVNDTHEATDHNPHTRKPPFTGLAFANHNSTVPKQSWLDLRVACT